MKYLARERYEQLTAGAQTLSADEHGVKVLLLRDGRVMKLFRRKRLFSSAMWLPYALRFARASRELQHRGIAAAIVEDVARVPAIRRDIVIYCHMNGASLREALAAGADHARLMPALADLLAKLHDRGVYFRAAHFGNVLAQDSGDNMQLALIDLSETRFRRRSLPPRLRARNFRPLTRYAEDLAAVQTFGVAQFIRRYLDAARLPRVRETAFLTALQGVDSAFASSRTRQ